jgi:uncharacterized protein (DUF2062 family)
MGLVAFGRWAALKLVRQSQQPHFVALGVAIGVAVAFFPILGTHMLIIALFCTLLRASFIAALVGSMLANPWTIGPMWAASFHLGRRILGMTPGGEGAIEHLNALGWGAFVERFWELLNHIIMPTIVGGALIGGPLAVGVYVIVYWWLRQRRGKEAK